MLELLVFIVLVFVLAAVLGAFVSHWLFLLLLLLLVVAFFARGRL